MRRLVFMSDDAIPEITEYGRPIVHKPFALERVARLVEESVGS